jgi:uncharacterized protein YjeT (DUF2065 family)
MTTVIVFAICFLVLVLGGVLLMMARNTRNHMKHPVNQQPEAQGRVRP